MPCDASGMAEIHRLYKSGFGEGPSLVEGVRDGDTAHASLVADHLATLSASLHAHHEFEDGKFWDPLTERAPGCALHVDRMKRQHAEMLVHLEAMDQALTVWRTTGRSADAEPIRQALAGINAALAEHLPDEEQNIVPVMESVLTQKEVDAASAHGRKATPKGQAFPMLGEILAAQPDGGTEWLHKHLPPPVRLIWRVLGQRKYEAHRRALVQGPN
ncbi:hemerythrin domain-containing protein [Ornithinimicrobium sp. F0845]|uniref:hemerythrin domain-containing protein n=1 Tax=Ornithinimicrobium sp. F0845 TaxID=2926412 RepID=UPI001FF494A5|nr:hemerythrin domain-containing protein [Ornithinimicrobium sp. F0845]MCK0113203.1 hemerythrin domain-containing protein [Ornithinimicrobium sp. F0845]